MPGSLKNALDWLVSATEPIDKPVLLIQRFARGCNPDAHAQFTEVLRTMSTARDSRRRPRVLARPLDARGEVTDEAMLAAIRVVVAKLQERS